MEEGTSRRASFVLHFIYKTKVLHLSLEIDIIAIKSVFNMHCFKEAETMKQTFFEQFEAYCITPGIDSGKARSYSNTLEGTYYTKRDPMTRGKILLIRRDPKDDINQPANPT